MSYANFGGLFAWPGVATSLGGAPAGATDATLDAAGEYWAAVFQAREAMTISHVAWRAGVVAGAPTADTRIETVGNDGIPTGALWNTNTNIVSGTLTSNTTTLHALTASATIAKSDYFAVKVLYNSGTSIIVQRVDNLTAKGLNVPYRVINTSGSPVKAIFAGGPNLALGSSTTTFYPMEKLWSGISTLTNTAFNNTAAGDKRGLRFQVPMACRCVGLMFYNSTSVGDFTAALFDDAGNEMSSSSTAVEGDRSANVANSAMPVIFDNAVDLLPNTWYRATVEPGATNITVGFVTLLSADYRSGWPGGLNHHYTTFTTAGGWVDTGTDRVPFMDVMLDQTTVRGHILVNPQSLVGS